MIIMMIITTLLKENTSTRKHDGLRPFPLMIKFEKSEEWMRWSW
jgi:hypothetical protein